MSGQHAPFEEESRGEPSSQIGSADVPGQQLQAASLGAATSTTHYLDRVRAVLILFGILALCITLIFAYGSKASPRSASQRIERACEADFLSLGSSLRNPWDFQEFQGKR